MDSGLRTSGCGLLAVAMNSWLWTGDSWLRTPGCGLLAVDSWLGTHGCKLLVVDSWLSLAALGVPGLSGNLNLLEVTPLGGRLQKCAGCFLHVTMCF